MNSVTKERSNSNSSYHNIKYTVLGTEIDNHVLPYRESAISSTLLYGSVTVCAPPQGRDLIRSEPFHASELRQFKVQTLPGA